MRSTQQVRDEVRKLVGIRLRQMRSALNYTQEAVASDLSLAHSTICSYESGTRAMSIDRLADFAVYYNIPISELFSSHRVRPGGKPPVADGKEKPNGYVCLSGRPATGALSAASTCRPPAGWARAVDTPHGQPAVPASELRSVL